MLVQPILPSVTRTVSGVSQVVDVDYYSKAQVLLDITAVAGLYSTLDVVIQGSPDGSRWFSYATFSEQASISKNKITLPEIAPKMRVNYEIDGNNPRFTFQVDIVLSR